MLSTTPLTFLHSSFQTSRRAHARTHTRDVSPTAYTCIHVHCAVTVLCGGHDAVTDLQGTSEAQGDLKVRACRRAQPPPSHRPAAAGPPPVPAAAGPLLRVRSRWCCTRWTWRRRSRPFRSRSGFASPPSTTRHSRRRAKPTPRLVCRLPTRTRRACCSRTTLRWRTSLRANSQGTRATIFRTRVSTKSQRGASASCLRIILWCRRCAHKSNARLRCIGGCSSLLLRADLGERGEAADGRDLDDA